MALSQFGMSVETAEEAMQRICGPKIDEYNRLQGEIMRNRNELSRAQLSQSTQEYVDVLKERIQAGILQCQSLHRDMTEEFNKEWTERTLREMYERKERRRKREAVIVQRIADMDDKEFDLFDQTFYYNCEGGDDE